MNAKSISFMVSKGIIFSINRKSIFLPSIQATKNFNLLKESKTQPKFTFNTSSMGWTFAHHKENNTKQTKFDAHRAGG